MFAARRATRGVPPKTPTPRAPIRGDSVLQRKVYWEDYFSDYDGYPPVDEAKFDMDQWMKYQSARDLYGNADKAIETKLGGASLLPMFENEPNLTLAISTDPNINPNHTGNTTLEFKLGANVPVMLGTDTVGAMGPLIQQGAHAIITVSIAYGEGIADVAHCLNHELSLHATQFLKFVRGARRDPNQDLKALADKLDLGGKGHHATFKTGGPGRRITVTHEEMLAQDVHQADNLSAAYHGDKDRYDNQGNYI